MPSEEQIHRRKERKLFMHLLKWYFFQKDINCVTNLNTMLNWELKSINRTKCPLNSEK